MYSDVGMVIERRFVFGVEDIASIVLSCPKCGHETTWNPHDNAYLPAQECGACKAQLLSRAPNGDDPTLALMTSIRRFRRVNSDLKAIVRFIVPNPD